MAIHPILPIGHPLLRQKAKKIHRFEPWVARLVEDMFHTLDAANGAGLAAPQIGKSLRVFVAQYEGRRVALINPEIGDARGEAYGTEGCLSLPGYVGENIRRAASIAVSARDARGKPVRFVAEGWFARILQHEADHLDGILFLDRLARREDLKRLAAMDEESSA